MQSSRICTAHLLTISCSARGGLANPLDAEPLWMQITLVMCPVMHAGKPPPDRMTDTGGTITLPQTSFASGNSHYTNAHIFHIIIHRR